MRGQLAAQAAQSFRARDSSSLCSKVGGGDAAGIPTRALHHLRKRGDPGNPNVHFPTPKNNNLGTKSLREREEIYGLRVPGLGPDSCEGAGSHANRRPEVRNKLSNRLVEERRTGLNRAGREERDYY